MAGANDFVRLLQEHVDSHAAEDVREQDINPQVSWVGNRLVLVLRQRSDHTRGFVLRRAIIVPARDPVFALILVMQRKDNGDGEDEDR